MRLIMITNFNQLTAVMCIYTCVYLLSLMRWFLGSAVRFLHPSVTVHSLTSSPSAAKEPSAAYLYFVVTAYHTSESNLPLFLLFLVFLFLLPFLHCLPSFNQLIHTISVVDRDEPQSGHRFFFTLAPEASSNRHFTLWDVKGERPNVLYRPVGEEGPLDRCTVSIFLIILFIWFIHLFLIRLKWCPLVLWLCFYFFSFISFFVFLFCRWVVCPQRNDGGSESDWQVQEPKMRLRKREQFVM